MKKPLIKQAGRIVFEGLESTKFWLRTFDQQKNIDMALELLAAKPATRERISCPIVSEYLIDERCKFVYVIMAQVDSLGICDGSGVLFYTSPEREREIYTLRDEIADDIMKTIKESDKPHEFILVDEGKEKGRESGASL
jgi:hypothetical protein